MKIETRNRKKWITIAPGEYYVTRKQPVITTLLGSCVAACLFDPVNRVAGMNHFLLAHHTRSKQVPLLETEEGRYGVNSMELLINKMLTLGADRKYIKAKAFGGGNVLQLNQSSPTQYAVGTANVEFIRRFLRKEQIGLISSDLGGDSGRVIRFDTEDYSVYVRVIKKVNINNIKEREKSYLENIGRDITDQKEKNSNIDLW
ncbi:MAG: chemotaxis protein CheD [Proteobacteria bacterium]|nr:chemotaxis protein CheD [Pseudomonadota bacterium]